MILTVSSDQEIGPQQTKAPSPTSPTRGMEIIRTPGVARDQDSAEKNAYSENIVTLDARLLQDILSGRWTRQQLYEPTSNWYLITFMALLYPGKVNLENMKLLLEAKDPFQHMGINPDYSL